MQTKNNVVLLKKLFIIITFSFLNCFSFAMEKLDNQKASTIISLLDAYMGQKFKTVRAYTIDSPDYEKDEKNYRFPVKKINKLLYVINGMAVSLIQGATFKNAEAAVDKFSRTPAQLTLQDKLCLQVLYFLQFSQNNDIKGKSEREVLIANRVRYNSVWALRDRSSFQEALGWQLYPKEAPFIPFAQKIANAVKENSNPKNQ